MRKALLALIAVESVLLAGGAAFHLLGGFERFRRPPPPVPVFRPPIHDTVIGDFVRYERRDPATGRALGYVDYEVKLVFVTEGSTVGPEILVDVKETGAGAPPRQRLLRIQPRAAAQGFLPPRLEEEEDYPAGARAVVKRISTATFPFRRREARGFLVEAVIPRRSLTEVAERYWMTDEVPLFGVARFERDGEVLVLHRMERPERRG